MDRATARLSCLLLFFLALFPVHAGDADDAQHCPNFLAWQNAHPELLNRNRIKRIEIKRPTEPKLRLQLLDMVKADRAARGAWSKESRTTDSAARNNLAAVDAANLKKLKPIILRQGFPKPAQVGMDGVEAAFLLVQHAYQDPAFQLHVLPQLAVLHRRGLISGEELAVMTDHSLRALGKPQRYGTQFMYSLNDSPHPSTQLQPVEDISKLDARRASMELPPLKNECPLFIGAIGVPRKPDERSILQRPSMPTQP